MCAFLCVAQMLPCSAYRHALQCQRFSRLLCVYLCVYVYICIRCSVKPYPSSVWAGSNAPPHFRPDTYIFLRLIRFKYAVLCICKHTPFTAFRNEIQLFFMGFLPCYMPCFASASIRLLLLFARNAYLIFSFIGVNGTLSPPRLGVPPLEVPNALPTPHLVGCSSLFPGTPRLAPSWLHWCNFSLFNASAVALSLFRLCGFV